MPPPDNPESVHTRPGTSPSPQQQQHRSSILKPPLPTLPSSRSRNNHSSLEIQLPFVIAGGLIAAFATAVADGLDNELLTHYYMSDDHPVKVNLDRVFDRLVAGFVRQIWDELWDFYYASNAEFARQLSLLFEGPVRQIVLILNGPELSRCILDRIGPGLSRRRTTWAESGRGVDLSLALQLVCRYWHHNFSSRSPGGNPDDIARSIHNHLLAGNAFKTLLARARRLLFTPHYVQMHLMESAVWDIILKRPARPPFDGFHVLQYRFECDPRNRLMEEGHLDIGSFPVIIGTAGQCLLTTVSQYVGRHWPRCGRLLLRCLGQALTNAAESFQRGQGFTGMSVSIDSDEDAVPLPGVRLIHFEIEEGVIRLSVAAWMLALVDITQQMAWMCAALSSSPFPEELSECHLQINNWDYREESIFVNCNMAHRAVPASEGASWLQSRRGVVVVPGFPIEEHIPQHTA